MEFLSNALGAVPQAASHPFALIAYLSVLIAWVVISLRVRRNSNLLQNIQHLPEPDRIRAIEMEMGHVSVPEGLAASDWLKQKRQQYFLIAFLALIFAGVIVFVIAAVQTTNTERSKAELLNVLEWREAALKQSFERLLNGQPLEELTFYEEGLSESDAYIKEELIRISNYTFELIERRRLALINGDLILAHEIGNEINGVGDQVQILISKSSSRIEELDRIVKIFSTMHPGFHGIAVENRELEGNRRRELEDLFKLYDFG